MFYFGKADTFKNCQENEYRESEEEYEVWECSCCGKEFDLIKVLHFMRMFIVKKLAIIKNHILKMIR